MAKLGVNVDHVATVRQARGGAEPDPVAAAAIAELAGADGITIHLREDRRHIQDRDLKLLRQTVKTRLNLEMAATDEMVAIALQTMPDMCTLVPEKRLELTTEGGLDVRGNRHHLRDVVAELHRHEIRVSLFIDPVREQVAAARDVEADTVEIHTGEFANARNEGEQSELLEVVRGAARYARELGMTVNAGHGLNYVNILPFRSIEEIDEVSIGHAVIARALFVGLEQAVRDMLQLVRDR